MPSAYVRKCVQRLVEMQRNGAGAEALAALAQSAVNIQHQNEGDAAGM
jgi:hypothetical protein